MTATSKAQFLEKLRKRNPNETEFHQAVSEFAETVFPYLEKQPALKGENLMERLSEPDRVISFRVAWLDDKGAVQVNRGYRVQFNNAIGPYKGGLRFHPTVNQSVLKFLAFEQIFKNSLTGLPIGGAKGGADFDPKGKSKAEIMRFCQAFMEELQRYIGPDVDVPAGDIGVGQREIGYLFGMYKKLNRRHTGTITGKGLTFGGSRIRPEATGYGLVYFLEEMLRTHDHVLEGKRVALSGSGNVAQYAAELAIQRGAKVITLSDSSGAIYDAEGLDEEKLDWIKQQKNEQHGRLAPYAEAFGAEYQAGSKPWRIPCDIALPCATQNEVEEADLLALLQNGCQALAEGANMPLTMGALQKLRASDMLYAPGKAANAGGVATSGLEMSQNSLRLSWSREEVREKLNRIMCDIHATCADHGRRAGKSIDYLSGANLGGFKKVAEATLAQGVI